MTTSRRGFTLALLALGALGTAGCGQKGPLFFPADELERKRREREGEPEPVPPGGVDAS